MPHGTGRHQISQFTGATVLQVRPHRTRRRQQKRVHCSGGLIKEAGEEGGVDRIGSTCTISAGCCRKKDTVLGFVQPN